MRRSTKIVPIIRLTQNGLIPVFGFQPREANPEKTGLGGGFQFTLIAGDAIRTGDWKSITDIELDRGQALLAIEQDQIVIQCLSAVEHERSDTRAHINRLDEADILGFRPDMLALPVGKTKTENPSARETLLIQKTVVLLVLLLLMKV